MDIHVPGAASWWPALPVLASMFGEPDWEDIPVELVAMYGDINERFHDTNVLEAFKTQRLSPEKLVSSK